MTSTALFVAVSYVALQLISNIGSIKVGFVLGYAVDMGVFFVSADVYPVRSGASGIGQRIDQKMHLFCRFDQFADVRVFCFYRFVSL